MKPEPPGSTADEPRILGGPAVRPEGPPDWPPERPEVLDALQRAYADGAWGKYDGPNAKRLRAALAALHEVAFVELCCSGTAAVEIALHAAKIGPGDEVVLAGYDFEGNFADVLRVGAEPVLVDPGGDNWNLDPQRLEDAIGERTKALLASHLHGGVVPMPRVMEIAEERGLIVIEDACQAPGAWIEGKRAGRWGHVGILSFGGSKLLTAGRGGALLTDDEGIAHRAKLHCWRGNHAYPLSELQATVLIPQVARLDADNAHRRRMVDLLCRELDATTGLKPFRNRSSTEATVPAYYKLGFRFLPECFGGLSREGFVAAVRAEGVAMDAGFRAFHRTHARRRYRTVGPLPISESADENAVVLHHPVLLCDAEAVRQVASAVRKVARHGAEIRRFLEA